MLDLVWLIGLVVIWYRYKFIYVCDEMCWNFKEGLINLRNIVGDVNCYFYIMKFMFFCFFFEFRFFSFVNVFYVLML